MVRPSAVRRALEIFSDPWAFAVLQEAFFGIHRFDHFQRNLGISRSVLTRRLGNLVARGVLERRRYQERPERFEYRLSESGREMYPIFVSLRAWGDRWLDEPDEPTVRLVHELCGNESRPRLMCDRCDREIRAEDMRYELSSLPSRPRAPR